MSAPKDGTERRCRHCGELEFRFAAADRKGCPGFELERREGTERRVRDVGAPHSNGSMGLDFCIDCRATVLDWDERPCENLRYRDRRTHQERNEG